MGEMLAYDDRYDIGWFQYYNRTKGNPHIGWGKGVHESPVHHWQVAAPLLLIGQLLGYLDVAREVEAAEAEESEEITGFKDLLVTL